MDLTAEQAKKILFSTEAKGLFYKVCNNLPFCINVVDADGIEYMLNDQFLEFLNLTREEIEGHHITDVDYTVRLPHVMATGKAELSKRHVFQNGREAICHRIPIMIDGQCIGGIGILAYESMTQFYEIVRENQKMDKQLKSYSNEVARLFTAKYKMEDIIGCSPVMTDLKENIKKFASNDMTVLITGESGTGKELVAQAIHNESLRREKAFVAINCSSIPEHLLESELFGYEPGTFTGASPKGKMGKFELANGGTIFLDEIGDMSYALQAKLLRVVQEKEIEKIGSSAPIPVDLRIVAATHKDLEDMVNKGQFRNDLYYRLNVLNIHVPPLRERKNDISLLSEVLLRQTRLSLRRNIKISEEVYELLEKYDWPGNVRELKNVIERIAVVCDEDFAAAEHVPSYIFDIISRHSDYEEVQTPLKTVVEKAEKNAIKNALMRNGNNKRKCARLLGINVRTLYRKLEYYSIEQG